jgi:hypothetical protein
LNTGPCCNSIKVHVFPWHGMLNAKGVHNIHGAGF